MIDQYILKESSSYQKFFKQAINILEQTGLDYCVIGGIALSFYDYNRATTDLDILISVSNLNKLKVILSTLDVKQVFGRRFKIPGFEYDLEFILEGEQLNTGDIVYPTPLKVRQWSSKYNCWAISLEMLITVKLYGFSYNRKRIKDLADVQELLLTNLDQKKIFLSWEFEDPKVQSAWKEVVERTLL